MFLLLHDLIKDEALYRIIAFIIAAGTGIVSALSLSSYNGNAAADKHTWLLASFGVLFGIVVGLHQIYQLIRLKPEK